MRLIISCLFMFAATSVFSQSSERYSVSVGSNVSLIRHATLDYKPGYFVAASLNASLSRRFGYYGSIQYSHEEAAIEGSRLRSNSATVIFAYTYSPIKNLEVQLGTFGGVATGVTIAGEDISDLDKGFIGAHTGCSYQFQQFQVQLRYNQYITEHLFDSAVQLGVVYRLGKNDE